MKLHAILYQKVVVGGTTLTGGVRSSKVVGPTDARKKKVR
jgi:hypothetical protein